MLSVLEKKGIKVPFKQKQAYLRGGVTHFRFSISEVPLDIQGIQVGPTKDPRFVLPIFFFAFARVAQSWVLRVTTITLSLPQWSVVNTMGATHQHNMSTGYTGIPPWRQPVLYMGSEVSLIPKKSCGRNGWSKDRNAPLRQRPPDLHVNQAPSTLWGTAQPLF